MEINNIIKNSELIKDDSVQVFKYKDEFIIKKKPYSEEIERASYVERDFLNYAKENWIKIHEIVDIIKEWNYLYVIYNYVKANWELDYYKIWENLKKLHLLKKEFDFSEWNEDDTNFEWAEKELEKILWKEILLKWNKIKEQVLKYYEQGISKNTKKCIIHWDFDLWNIIAPDIIIDTEEMRMWPPEYEIVAFFRMWYRYGNKNAMNKILEWYGYTWTVDDLKAYFWYKDLTVTNWLILNNKWDKNRIEDIKNRIEDWYSWDYKWVLYS